MTYILFDYTQAQTNDKLAKVAEVIEELRVKKDPKGGTLFNGKFLVMDAFKDETGIFPEELNGNPYLYLRWHQADDEDYYIFVEDTDGEVTFTIAAYLNYYGAEKDYYMIEKYSSVDEFVAELRKIQTEGWINSHKIFKTNLILKVCDSE